jgi:tripartite-type tricarboxylate transporter receptor subunit TctC
MPTRRSFLAATAALCAASRVAWGQDLYPARPIRLIVPFSPGAGTDTVARFVAHKLGESMQASIVVENRTGAGGAIGAAEAAKAEPDGYTLLFVASPFTTVAASTKAPGYDPLKHFVAVSPIASGPLAFVVHPDVPANTMREFIAYAKQHPGRINYGSAGPGSVNHLALELFMARTGTEIVHVPYRGIADATKDLISGQLQAMTASIPATLPLLAERRVKVLAVTGEARIPQLANVPSWQEEGVSDANVINYWGIVAPVGTPRAIVARLNAATQKLLGQSEVRMRLEREGAQIIAGDPQRLTAIIERDLASWRKLITEARLAFQ